VGLSTVAGLYSNTFGTTPRAKASGQSRKRTSMTDIGQYDYHLPRELIAQVPRQHRSDARLMLIDRGSGSIDHRHVRDLPSQLRPGDCLVLNNSRVIPAKLVGYRTNTGGKWQGLFLEADRQGSWRVMSRTRGKLEAGETITLVNRGKQPVVTLRLATKLADGCWAARPESELPTMEILQQAGRVPLPPYIRGGEMRDDDRRSYQTVYARQDGSIAAPTAGLHFTNDLLKEIRQKNVRIVEVTLHVGTGTFRPMATQQIEDHAMHAEWGCIDREQVDELKAVRRSGGRIIAVGTTSVRLLETASKGGELSPWEGPTDLFIRPPYKFHSVDALMTNFHLPKSTLLVLVRTFGGQDLLKRAYEEAIDDAYRFFSYGDAMLIT